VNLADHLVEHVNVHRLREVTTKATRFGALSVDFLRVAGNGDERHVMQTAVDPQPLRKKIALVGTAHYLARVMFALLTKNEAWRESAAA
jgi:hypothetical protein